MAGLSMVLNLITLESRQLAMSNTLVTTPSRSPQNLSSLTTWVLWRRSLKLCRFSSLWSARWANTLWFQINLPLLNTQLAQNQTLARLVPICSQIMPVDLQKQSLSLGCQNQALYSTGRKKKISFLLQLTMSTMQACTQWPSWACWKGQVNYTQITYLLRSTSRLAKL